jgi:hypothetical protein
MTILRSSLGELNPSRARTLASLRFEYAAYYCEENLLRLAGDPRVRPGRRYAVLLTNEARRCAVWAQKIARHPGEPVLWDYHAIMMVAGPDGTFVYDLDSTLPLPSRFEDYARRALGPSEAIPAEYRPRFRLIDAELYRRAFSSDRSHMRNPDGSFKEPPPPWPPFLSSDPEAFTLEQALDLARPAPGEVLTLEELWARFG